MTAENTISFAPHYELSSKFIEKRINNKERPLRPRSREEFLKKLESQDYPFPILYAFASVDRALFLPEGIPDEYVYSAIPWPISEEKNGTSVSQPDVVAEMMLALDAQEGNTVLEVGTASGYQAALLEKVVGKSGAIITTEIDKDLPLWAQLNLKKARSTYVQQIMGDAAFLSEGSGIFDRVILTASLPPFPLEHQPFISRLSQNGKIVAPLGGFGASGHCHLLTIQKDETGMVNGKLDLNSSFSFVNVEGEYGWSQFNVGFYLAMVSHLCKQLDIPFDLQEYVREKL